MRYGTSGRLMVILRTISRFVETDINFNLRYGPTHSTGAYKTSSFGFCIVLPYKCKSRGHYSAEVLVREENQLLKTLQLCRCC